MQPLADEDPRSAAAAVTQLDADLAARFEPEQLAALAAGLASFVRPTPVADPSL